MPTFSCRGSVAHQVIMLAVLGLVLLIGAAHAQGQNAQGGSDTSEGPKASQRLNWPSAWPPEVTGGTTTQAPSQVPNSNEKSSTKPEDQPASPPAVAKDATARQPADAATSPAEPSPPAGAQQGAPAAESRPPSSAEAPKEAPKDASKQAQPSDGASQQPAQPEPKKARPVELSADVAKDIETAKSVASRLDSVEKSVERVRDRADELAQRLSIIEKINSDASAVAARLSPALASIKSQIDKLGPAPTDGKEESDQIAAERKRLQSIAAEIDGALKTAELSQVRARQLVARVQLLLIENFRKGLFARSPSFFSPDIWQESFTAIPRAGQQLVSIFSDWGSRAANQLPSVLLVTGIALVLGFGLEFLSRRLRILVRHREGETTPPFSARVTAAGLEAPLRMLPKIVFATVLYLGLNSLNLLYLQVGGLALAAYKALVVAAAGLAFTTAYLQPARPQWRVIDLGDPAAWQARRFIRAAILLFAVDIFIRDTISELFLPLSVSILWTALTALAFAVLFSLGARVTPQTPEGAQGSLAIVASRLHQLPLAIAAIAIVTAVVSRFVSLGHFIATQLPIVFAGAFLLVIFYLANRAIAAEPDDDRAMLSGEKLAIPIEVRRGIARGLSILLDIVLFVTAIPVMLLALGYAPAEISAITNRALFGFEVGGVEISLFKVGGAVALFSVILLLSRMVQRWLGNTILHPNRIEQGLGNSIRTGIGYLGFLFAALIGLSYAGLDITNLAIIAGALSVGIGFGLQSIVNNFISGLILLVERPIKVGDWIKVGEMQGYVRRISVRSTEMETFERASVIIPNSELISGTVVNMTLRNAIGRITIPVGVSYKSDPEVVHKLLLECAAQTDLVARHPAPFVVFEDFGDSALIFSLRIYVPDVNTSLAAQTLVRKAIFAKFREAGIEIPFPQQDLHLRDLDGLKSALFRALEERRQTNAETVYPTDGAREGGRT